MSEQKGEPSQTLVLKTIVQVSSIMMRHTERVGYLVIFFITAGLIVGIGGPIFGPSIVLLFTPGWSIGGALFKSFVECRRQLQRKRQEIEKIVGPIS